jgi:hypothetical protein
MHYIVGSALPIDDLKQDIFIENTYTSHGVLKKSYASTMSLVKSSKMEVLTINETRIDKK